jgi:ATP-dependent DNA helicase DinG
MARRPRWPSLRKPADPLGVRLEALLAEPPDWLDGPGRARIEGARHSLQLAHVDLLAAWEALLANAVGGPADPNSSTGSRSTRFEGARI